MKQYLIENDINEKTNNKLPLIIIKLIASFLLEPIIYNINYIINDAFKCYNCSLTINNYFNCCCSERCLLQIQGIYSDDDDDYVYEYDSYDAHEQYIENCRQDARDDYYSD